MDRLFLFSIGEGFQYIIPANYLLNPPLIFIAIGKGFQRKQGLVTGLLTRFLGITTVDFGTSL